MSSLMYYVLILCLFNYFITITSQYPDENCTDFLGNVITHGLYYVPGPDECSLCVCYNTEPRWCRPIQCDAPPKCLNFKRGVRCCEYDCIEKAEEWDEFVDGFDKNKSETITFSELTEFLFSVLALAFSFYFH